MKNYIKDIVVGILLFSAPAVHAGLVFHNYDGHSIVELKNDGEGSVWGNVKTKSTNNEYFVQSKILGYGTGAATMTGRARNASSDFGIRVEIKEGFNTFLARRRFVPVLIDYSFSVSFDSSEEGFLTGIANGSVSGGSSAGFVLGQKLTNPGTHTGYDYDRGARNVSEFIFLGADEEPYRKDLTGQVDTFLTYNLNTAIFSVGFDK